MTYDLSTLKVGQQLWFWLSSKKPKEGPPLFITEVQKDPSMEVLMEKVLTAYRATDGVTGTAIVGSDKKVVFTGQMLSAKSLKNFSRWLHKNKDRYSGWGQLAGSRFLEVSEKGIVTAMYDDDALWSGFELPHTPGTAEDVQESLQKIAVGESGWIWFGQDKDDCHLLVMPMKDDPKAKDFLNNITQIAENYSLDNTSVHGVLRKLKHGWLLTTTQKNGDWCEQLQDWILSQSKRFPQLVTLRQLKIGMQEEDQLSKIVSLSFLEDDSGFQKGLLELKEGFEELVGGEEFLFWYSTDFQGYLSIAKETKALKAQVKDYSALTKKRMRGKLKISSKGYPVFRSKGVLEGFLPSLAHWWNKHKVSYPFIDCIQNARFVQIDENNQPIAKEKNNSLWS